MGLTRRDALKVGVLGGAELALPLEKAVGGVKVYVNRIAESALPAPFTVPFAIPPVIKPVRQDLTTDYYRVTMAPTVVEMIPGYQTSTWAYNGSVPGPTFRCTQGRKAVVRQINNLPAKHPTLNYTPWTSVHLHGDPFDDPCHSGPETPL